MRGTTLSRHTLSEIEALSLPRLQTALSEAVAYGELGFSGALPMVGTAATEIAALVVFHQRIIPLARTKHTYRGTTNGYISPRSLRLLKIVLGCSTQRSFLLLRCVVSQSPISFGSKP
jgi:hypothetical protein